MIRQPGKSRLFCVCALEVAGYPRHAAVMPIPSQGMARMPWFEYNCTRPKAG